MIKPPKEFHQMFPIKVDEYTGDYFWGAGGEMVADMHDDELRVRGWGAIQYLKDPEQYQDFIRDFIKDAINEKYERDYK